MGPAIGTVFVFIAAGCVVGAIIFLIAGEPLTALSLLLGALHAGAIAWIISALVALTEEQREVHRMLRKLQHADEEAAQAK